MILYVHHIILLVLRLPEARFTHSYISGRMLKQCSTLYRPENHVTIDLRKERF